ncbi:MAG: hypothetical protein EXQ49_10295 [Acidobacteria bacterium]|nr:hypothetical protein [Acidobacteriota bacterium]
MRSQGLGLSLVLVMLAVVGLGAQVQMPNPKEMSGRPLPAADVPVGTVTVRVIRGGFDKDVPNQPVEFTIDGTARVVNTDASGRATVSGLRSGTSVTAGATVDGERLESQTFVMGSSGMRVALVATDPDDTARAAEDKTLASAPATKGIVVLGPGSRVVVELGEDGLRVFYLMEILNTARTPVDIGGPLIFELPQGARGTTILPESSPQGSANGPRLIVTGPFAPGATMVDAAYELPYRGATVTLDQVWPATLQQLSLIVEQQGALDISSPQVSGRGMMASQGKPFISASGAAIQAGQTLTVNFSGLPNRPAWPRWVALIIGLSFVSWGLWSVWTAPVRRRV